MNTFNPSEWAVSLELMTAALALAIGAAWASRAAYTRVMAAIERLQRDVEQIKARNEAADREAHEYHTRQHASETTQAVLTSQLTALAATVDRIDRKIETLIDRGRA